MREIKFRSFNGIYMDEVVGYEYNCGGCDNSTIVVCDKETGIERYNTVDADIMQYTGLKDIDGKEIFEGDVVQCNGNKEDLHQVKYGEFEVYSYDSDDAIDTVLGWHFQILENDKFSKVVPFCYPTPLNNHWIKKIDIKVIGNIYENKNLLEGGK